MIDIKNARVSSYAELEEIYLAGGCFWGLQYYYSKVRGVIKTEVGYTNGNTSVTDYTNISKTRHAECVYIKYDPYIVSLEEILIRFFAIIDPLSINKQGNDIGLQYRSGIYYENQVQKNIIDKVMAFVQSKLSKQIVTEVLPLKNYVPAELYHQDYLYKNKNGYCSIDKSSLYEPIFNRHFNKYSDEKLKNSLSDIQYEVTQYSATEAPHTGEYNKNINRGLYVDITSGEPLFLSDDKFDAGCGWPSFTKAIFSYTLSYLFDGSRGRERVEVRGDNSNSHLGHVFEDGMEDKGKLRYCINSAALRFVDYTTLKDEGYADYEVFFRL